MRRKEVSNATLKKALEELVEAVDNYISRDGQLEIYAAYLVLEEILGKAKALLALMRLGQ
jgi:hypothetical protein